MAKAAQHQLDLVDQYSLHLSGTQCSALQGMGDVVQQGGCPWTKEAKRHTFQNLKPSCLWPLPLTATQLQSSRVAMHLHTPRELGLPTATAPAAEEQSPYSPMTES